MGSHIEGWLGVLWGGGGHRVLRHPLCRTVSSAPQSVGGASRCRHAQRGTVSHRIFIVLSSAYLGGTSQPVLKGSRSWIFSGTRS